MAVQKLGDITGGQFALISVDRTAYYREDLQKRAGQIDCIYAVYLELPTKFHPEGYVYFPAMALHHYIHNEEQFSLKELAKLKEPFAEKSLRSDKAELEIGLERIGSEYLSEVMQADCIKLINGVDLDTSYAFHPFFEILLRTERVDLRNNHFWVHYKGKEEEALVSGDFETVFSWLNIYTYNNTLEMYTQTLKTFLNLSEKYPYVDISDLQVSASDDPFRFAPKDAKEWFKWGCDYVLPELPEKGRDPKKPFYVKKYIRSVDKI